MQKEGLYMEFKMDAYAPAASKPLGHGDESGFEFSKEMLGEDCTAAINFDRLQKHPQAGYIMIEYLLCEEAQKVTPYTSHPNRYWKKNAAKFLALWQTKLDFNATLYLVNYAKKGTKAENEVLLIKVLDMDETGITEDERTQYTRTRFSEWFKRLNEECLSGKDELIKRIYMHKSIGELGKMVLQGGKHAGETIESVYRKEPGYLEWLKGTIYPYAKAAWCYLDKLGTNNKT